MRNLTKKNVVFLTLDSLGWGVAKDAKIPFMRSIGEMRMAYTHADYTVPAHTAFFSGHLPVVLNKPLLPYYSESIKQLWRIKTGYSRDTKTKKCGILLGGNNILEGYRKIGFYVLGTGGVTQFSDGSLLREFFGKDFLYYGQNLDEEPLAPRAPGLFPSNHIDEIMERINEHDKWFIFINVPSTHYPYDSGGGILQKTLNDFANLKECLNLGRKKIEDSVPQKIFDKFKHMQLESLERVDKRLQSFFNKLPKNRGVLVVICGDHGDNFGECFEGERRWGHLFPSPQTMQVPLIIGEIGGKK